jgi:hypothetical protein
VHPVQIKICLFTGLLFFSLLPLEGYGQSLYFYSDSIHIGQRADSVLHLVSKEVQERYDNKAYLTRANAETIDYKGTLKEVLLTEQNVLIRNFQKGVNVRIRFVMESDTLSHILTQYLNLTAYEARQLSLSGKVNMGDYYFDPGYKAYTCFFDGKNGSVIADYRKTLIGQIPITIRLQLRMIAGIW